MLTPKILSEHANRTTRQTIMNIEERRQVRNEPEKCLYQNEIAPKAPTAMRRPITNLSHRLDNSGKCRFLISREVAQA